MSTTPSSLTNFSPKSFWSKPEGKPGMILAAVHLLDKNRQPTRKEISEGLSGNLCRCTGYSQIVEAVAEAARRKTMA